MFHNSYFSEREIRMNKSIFAIIAFFLASGVSSSALAETMGSESYQAEDVYHGISESGLTGLGMTVSPYTMGTGISASVNVFAEPTTGGTAVITMPSVTLGLGNSVELSARTALVTAPGLSEVGDTEVSAKYRFRAMSESMPSMAIVASAYLPTASNAAVADVSAVSGRIMVVAGGEAQVSDTTVVGMYLNYSHFLIDPGTATQVTYDIANVGLMIPISDDQRLQGMLEAFLPSGKPTVTTMLGGTNPHYRIGLRYATRFLKVTAGVETGWVGAAVTGGVTFEL